ncbi:MAG: 3-phosphoglycerate kinase [Verrucomicrobiales bacterium]
MVASSRQSQNPNYQNGGWKPPLLFSHMAKKHVKDLEVKGKRVLVRVDFNVPLSGGEITDDTRIQGALPTINHLVEAGAKVILMSHLGRPEGTRDPGLSLAPVATRLGKLVSAPVKFVDDCVGPDVAVAVGELGDGEILLLENTRYHAAEDLKCETDEEKEALEAFAKQLAENGDIFVNDAFGTAHRYHASTAAIANYVDESAMGFLIELELEYLEGKLANPESPFVVIMGGAKVSDKIQVITSLLGKADTIIIGGAMAYTFRKAQGHEIGDSLVENDKQELALQILKDAEAKGTKFMLPADTRHTAEFKDDAPTEVCAPFSEGGSIPAGREGIDIGDKAIEDFCAEIAGAKTVLWNGPMGVFERRGFDIGTKAVAEAVASSGAVSIIGGGDSVTAIKKFGYGDKVTFMSTGGGASLELLEGKELPGIAALDDA